MRLLCQLLLGFPRSRMPSRLQKAPAIKQRVLLQVGGDDFHRPPVAVQPVLLGILLGVRGCRILPKELGDPHVIFLRWHVSSSDMHGLCHTRDAALAPWSAR